MRDQSVGPPTCAVLFGGLAALCGKSGVIGGGSLLIGKVKSPKLLAPVVAINYMIAAGAVIVVVQHAV